MPTCLAHPHAERRRPQLALAVVALLALTACGPEKSPTVGMKDVATDILLKRARPSAPAIPPTQAPTGFPFVPTPVAPPLQGDVIPLPTATTAPPPPALCPTASPLLGATRPAPNRPSAPPKAGNYPVRVDGNYSITGENAAKGVYGPTGSRKVQDVSGNASAWTYAITSEDGLTTTYAVRPHQAAADDTPIEVGEQPLPTQAGIYVAQFSYRRSDGAVLDLTPDVPLMVAKLPLSPGDKWTSRGVDAETGYAIVVNGQTGLGTAFSPAKARVDACGTVLDAWWVEYTVDTTPATGTGAEEPPSEIRGADIDIEFVGSRVAFGTQYGGLPIEEFYRLRGTDGADTVDITRHAIYSSEPAPVGAGT